jgi:branched-chain amino acid transport system substrate-binding protein
MLALAVSVGVIGCSTSQKGSGASRLPSRASTEEPEKVIAPKMLWEVWPLFQDLNGQLLRDRSLILGDELQQQGKRRLALDAYLKASSDTLADAESEAAAIRIASQHLALDQPDKALSAVGAYHKRRNLGEAEVSVPFALVLAFGYGRQGDNDQSLAWFSNVSTKGRQGGPAVSVAGSGVSLLLRSLPDQEFERIGQKWQSDTFISQAVGRERLRRASAGYAPPDESASKLPFWEAGAAGALAGGVAGASSGAPAVGLILSLSDRFGALGRDTKQGFELAVEANNSKGSAAVRVVARDVGADTAAASAAVRELATGERVSAIVGPLLTEPAVVASQTAREVGVPLVSLSKSESFAAGSGIFRLGATSSSQIDAVVNSAYGEYGITRFASAYPQTAGGLEFLEALKTKLGALGLALDTELAYVSSDDTSLFTVAEQLESSTAEAVLIPDTIEVSERILRNFSPALRRRIRPLGTALWDNATKIARSQALFERALFVTPFFAQSNRAEVQRFIESYRGRYNITPNFLAAQGFDVGTLVMNALSKSARGIGSFEAMLLQSPPYSGVTGTISVSPSGEIARRFYVVEVLRDTFQEKMPPSNPQRPAARAVGEAKVGGAAAPLLGSEDRVDSGY